MRLWPGDNSFKQSVETGGKRVSLEVSAPSQVTVRLFATVLTLISINTTPVLKCKWSSVFKCLNFWIIMYLNIKNKICAEWFLSVLRLPPAACYRVGQK